MEPAYLVAALAITSAITTAATVYLRLFVSSKLNEVNTEIDHRIDMKYVSREILNVRLATTETAIATLLANLSVTTDRLRELHEYAHDSTHELRNAMQLLVGRCEVVGSIYGKYEERMQALAHLVEDNTSKLTAVLVELARERSPKGDRR